jgi:hypothetical protein
MKVTVTKSADNISRDIERRQAQLAKLPEQAFQVFRESTPRATGNARKNTRLRGAVIEANYPYAQRLDDGYSPKSPQGMTQPTEQFLQKTADKIMKR